MNLTKLAQIQSKIVNLQQLKKLCAIWRIKGSAIVFTNGCFDILHQGHIELIMQAANEGNRLVVVVNSNESVKRLKGVNRPINDEQSRALLLAALQFVDAVCIFDEDTPINLIKELLPDVLVKGGDYTLDNIVGASEVQSNGGRVVIIPTVDGFSTTNIIDKMK